LLRIGLRPSDAFGHPHRCRKTPNPKPARYPGLLQRKVVETQGRTSCELLNLYLDGNTAIAEWQAEFDDLPQGIRKRMREVAILVFEDQLIASLREYWATQVLAQPATSEQ
jgi:hypothetical protein